ncbi:hypothetical protein [Luteimonas aquatica]|uniref:hypothetical protein n=1 Tax=Luteimonas aquatica TaxID=450364 RepID=UPI001F593312|nr:hypothetical protein [Luteimonas aquatica]
MSTDPQPASGHRFEGYNDKPVEARLGPHRYLIPANYFDNQIGPEFDGSFSLKVQWPDLQPLPPGERSRQSMETFNKQISILPNYVDRVPITAVLEKLARPAVSEDSISYQDPRERLDLRIEQPASFGLTPYWVDEEKLAAYAKSQEQASGHPYRIKRELEQDWYLRRTGESGIATLIKCDTHASPDGLTVQGERVLADDSTPIAQCTHYFVDPTSGISFSASYARVFLKDWKRIEDRAHELLAQYRVD